MVGLLAGIEHRREHRRQAAENVEVVPLDHRSGGRRGNDSPDVALAGQRISV